MTRNKPPDTGTARAETEHVAMAMATKVCVSLMMMWLNGGMRIGISFL